MVSIRLSRTGKKSHANFRFVVSDKRRDMYGPALEILGWYDPHVNPTAINVKADRVQHWLSKGAQPSATVHNLLVTAGIINAPKKVIVKPPKKESVKVEEKKAEAPAAEAPKVEVKVEDKKEEAPKEEAKN
jgi:small subunit ribosomal protein S16